MAAHCYQAVLPGVGLARFLDAAARPLQHQTPRAAVSFQLLDAVRILRPRRSDLTPGKPKYAAQNRGIDFASDAVDEPNCGQRRRFSPLCG